MNKKEPRSDKFASRYPLGVRILAVVLTVLLVLGTATVLIDLILGLIGK